MKELLDEMNNRMIVLENMNQTNFVKGRIDELQLCIIRVQQILLKTINT